MLIHPGVLVAIMALPVRAADPHQHHEPAPPAAETAAPQAPPAAVCPGPEGLADFHARLHPRFVASERLCPPGGERAAADAASQRNFHDVCGAQGKIFKAPFWGYFVLWAQGQEGVLGELGDYDKKYFMLRYGQTSTDPNADPVKAKQEAFEMWVREGPATKLAALWARQLRDGQEAGRIGGWPASKKVRLFGAALQGYDADVKALNAVVEAYEAARKACEAADASGAAQGKFEALHKGFTAPPAPNAVERLAGVLSFEDAARFRKFVSGWAAAVIDVRR